MSEKRTECASVPGEPKQRCRGRPRRVDHDRIRAEWDECTKLRVCKGEVLPPMPPAEFARRHGISERQLRRVLAGATEIDN